MWSYVKFIFGIILIFASAAGALSLFSGDVERVGRRIVENGVDTTGVIESRTEHLIAGRWGRIAGAGRYYTIKYNFTTLDGRTYSSEINVSQDQAYTARDGQQIRVRYYADQPSVNSALGFKEYMTDEDVKNAPLETFLLSALLMLIAGAWLIVSSWKHILPAPITLSVTQQVSTRAQSAAPRPRGTIRAHGNLAFGKR